MKYARAKQFAAIAFVFGVATFLANPKLGGFYAIGGFIFFGISAQVIKVLHTNDPDAQNIFPVLGFDGEISENEAIPLLVGLAMLSSPIVSALCFGIFSWVAQ